MSTSEKREQLDLFRRPRLDVVPKVKAAMSHAVKRSGLSREQFIDRLVEVSREEGIPIRAGNGFISTFEKWLNPADHDHVIPLRYLSLFCAVTKDTTPIAALAWPLDADVVGPRERAIIKLGLAAIEKKRAMQLGRQAEEEARTRGLL